MAKIVANFEYTDTELLALAKEGLAHLFAGGAEYSVGSRRFRRVEDMQKYIDWLEDKVNRGSGDSWYLAKTKRVNGL